ncbi:MAG: RNA methyltransferase [Fibrobacterota bacterium]
MASAIHVKNCDTEMTAEEYGELPRNPVSVILDNLRSAYNVGSIFRTSDAAALQSVCPCGYTVCPPSPKLAKTAMGAECFMAWEHFDRTISGVQEFKRRGYHVAALETCDCSEDYSKRHYDFPLCLVVGNEALGVSSGVLKEADSIIKIPQMGYKNSLNVSVAFGIVVFEIVNQFKKRENNV